MRKKIRLWFILGGVVVILAAAIVLIYISTLQQGNRRNQLETDNSLALLQLTQGNTEKQKLQSDITALQTQLNKIADEINKVGFIRSAESIEYDAIFFSIAGTHSLNVMNITSSLPKDIARAPSEINQPKYQSTTFTINVDCILPSTLFQTGIQSKQYIITSVNNILGFINTIVASNDFKTVIISSVDINSPEPLTDAQVAELLEIHSTDPELTVGEIIVQTGFFPPSANIILEILTYKGG